MDSVPLRSELGDPSLYDVVLNLESMDIREACDVIAGVASLKCFEETALSTAAMNDLAVASKVRATLVCAPSTVDLEVEVSVQGGAITVKGTVRDRDQLSAVRELAQKVAEGREIDLEGLVFRPDL